MTVTVKELKVVQFPAGYLRSLNVRGDQYVAQDREYIMVVLKGRGGVYFGVGDLLDGGSNEYTAPFAKAALKRTLTSALDIKSADEDFRDERTGIEVRGVGRVYVELSMPCGEVACVKKSTIKRLVKELA